MILVLPHYAGDLWLLIKNLGWYQELDGKLPYEVVLSSDTKTDSKQAVDLAKQIFKKVYVFKYDRIAENNWPRPQNHSFMSLAWYMYDKFKKQSFFWVETDCVPMCPGWIQKIEECHIAGKKPFTGHWNETAPSVQGHVGVFNGSAVYPWNISSYAPRAMTAALCEGNQPPWDVYCSSEVEPHLNKANHLFQHIWRDDETGEAYSFKSAEQVAKVVRPGVVLFHRVKDFSLVPFLRSPEAIQRERATIQTANTIHVQRTAAIGDAITASVVADKLKERGFNVVYHCDPNCGIPLKGTQQVAPPIPQPDINLDGAYENSKERKTKPCTHIFIDEANRQLQKRGIVLDYANATPRIKVEQKSIFINAPRPWIVVSPRSNSFVNRTVPKEIWEQLAKYPIGTWLWVGTDPAPAGFNDCGCRDVETLTAYIASCDLCVSVDTGPLHIAAGLGKPVIGIAQSNTPWLTDQRDFSVISAPLGCINCHELKCPINETTPPCGNVNVDELAALVRAKWLAYDGMRISAVICIYKPNVERLNKCLTHVLPQVDEIVIAVDGDGAIPAGVIQSQRIKWVQNTTGQRRGYGKTANHAVRHSTGRYILLLNDDVYLKPDAVSKMFCAMAVDVAIVGCRLWYPDGTIQHGGGFRNPGDIGWGHLDVKKKVPTIRKRTEMEFVTLAASLVRREAFYQAMGFNESFDCYCEDGQLCLDVRKNGWKIVYEPSAEGIHEESQTTGAMKKELGKASYAIFRERWREYFQHNKDNQMGVFT